ncbi:MAG: hypothetical protein LBD50_00485 [Rickettsiales bacterium]|jgi:hypothetical protein|nr:hypothetical protein [Rickettsiales bacterium]
MNFFKKAGNKISAKKDLNIIVSYMKSRLKFELDCARYAKNTRFVIDANDSQLVQASNLADSVITDFDEIKRRTELQKKNAIKNKNGAELSPDEIFMIDMSALRDIKKAGLKKPLTPDERKTIRSAVQKFGQIYSEQIRIYNARGR